MINCLCVIQAGQGPDLKRDELENMLDGYTREHLLDDVNVTWLPVARGSGFTEGRPSTSSVLSIATNEPLEQTKREFLLRELVSLWTQRTGCSIDEVVAVIADPAQG